MKNALILLIAFIMTSILFAQDAPTVEIRLSQPTAQLNDNITADVYVHNGLHVAGIDIRTRVDNACLQILDRQPGTYLPTTSEEGAFSPFEELNDHDTRFAAALTDRTKNASGDGIFYSIQLKVICETGTAPLEITYAKLSTYKDPSAEAISLISFALDDGTLTTINTELVIVPSDRVSTEATSTDDATVVDQQPTSVDDDATVLATPTSIVETTEPLEQTDNQSTQQSIIILLVALIISASIILLGMFFWWKRRSSKSNHNE